MNAKNSDNERLRRILQATLEQLTAIDRVLAGKKKFKSAADMIEAIYLLNR